MFITTIIRIIKIFSKLYTSCKTFRNIYLFFFFLIAYVRDKYTGTCTWSETEKNSNLTPWGLRLHKYIIHTMCIIMYYVNGVSKYKPLNLYHFSDQVLVDKCCFSFIWRLQWPWPLPSCLEINNHHLFIAIQLTKGFCALGHHDFEF